MHFTFHFDVSCLVRFRYLNGKKNLHLRSFLVTFEKVKKKYVYFKKTLNNLKKSCRLKIY